MLRKIRKMLQQQEGFTLVELMIVVVILGILAGVGIQQYGRVQHNARVAAHNANVKVITSAVNMYLMVNDEAPEDIAALATAGYLDAVPRNPFGEDGDEPAGAYTVTFDEEPEEDGFFNFTVAPGAMED